MAMRIVRNPILRVLYTVLGLLSLGLAIVATFIPFVPTFDLLLIAAFFFAMSNERLYKWLLNHPRFGPPIRDYRAGLGITKRAKIWAGVAIGITFGATILFATDNLVVRLLMVAIAGGIMAFILTRPTKPVGVSAPSV